MVKVYLEINIIRLKSMKGKSNFRRKSSISLSDEENDEIPQQDPITSLDDIIDNHDSVIIHPVPSSLMTHETSNNRLLIESGYIELQQNGSVQASKFKSPTKKSFLCQKCEHFMMEKNLCLQPKAYFEDKGCLDEAIEETKLELITLKSYIEDYISMKWKQLQSFLQTNIKIITGLVERKAQEKFEKEKYILKNLAYYRQKKVIEVNEKLKQVQSQVEKLSDTNTDKSEEERSWEGFSPDKKQIISKELFRSTKLVGKKNPQFIPSTSFKKIPDESLKKAPLDLDSTSVQFCSKLETMRAKVKTFNRKEKMHS